MDIDFRRLTDDDLELVHGWLNEPGVVRWWEGDDVSWDGIVRDYGSASTDPTEHWLALLDRHPVGWIQCYATADHPPTRTRSGTGGPWASIRTRPASTTSSGTRSDVGEASGRP